MFHNKNVVVTGAGRGIGRALAQGFATQGATVLVHYGNAQQQAEEVVRQIEAEGGRAVLAQADLRMPGEAARLVVQAREKLGSIDVWINNAGLLAAGAFDETPMSVHEKIIDQNRLFGVGDHGAGADHGFHDVSIFLRGTEMVIRNGAGVMTGAASAF